MVLEPLNATGTPLGKVFAHLTSQRPPYLSTKPPPPRPPFALTSPPALQVGPGFHVPVGVTVCTAACEAEEDEEPEFVNVAKEVVETEDEVVVVVVVVVVVGTDGVDVEGPLVAPVSDKLVEPVAAGTLEDVTAEEV